MPRTSVKVAAALENVRPGCGSTDGPAVLGSLQATPGFVGTVVAYAGTRELGRREVKATRAGEGWGVDLVFDAPRGEGRVVLLAGDGTVLDEERVLLRRSPPAYCG